ncbi:MAG: hypothetical protein K6U14_02145 [Firmicutes bacterium]|nr:hypothetical protein [Alicyclobacillaceae bacterium]MCL6496422.1 hypothetical protein [Bacillota bacterium]
MRRENPLAFRFASDPSTRVERALASPGGAPAGIGSWTYASREARTGPRPGGG